VKKNIGIINVVNNILLIALLFIIVGQGYITFLKHEEKFENPLKFVKQNYGNDYITQYGHRFKEIKKMFPKPAHLCYIGEDESDFAIWLANYTITQYYLSPNILIKNNINCDTILYNLHNSIHINPETNIHLRDGWHVIKDFNNGLILFAK
jgi:hypothetical protein